MKYDDASWHSGGEFPEDLPQSAGATHIAMFAAWAALHGLIGSLHRTDLAEELKRLEQRRATPAIWFRTACDGKLTNEDLNDEGNAFARDYYMNIVDGEQIFGPYYSDYETEFSEAKSLYHVEDSWKTYERLDSVLSARFAEWKKF